MTDHTTPADRLSAGLTADHSGGDTARIIGYFTAICRDHNGGVLWAGAFPNLLTTLGKNLLLDTTLAGSAYTTVGPFMGLISSASFSAVSAADTMSAHAGWLEAGTTNAPTFSVSGARPTCVWSSASAGVKALSAGLVFTFTGAGTVQGAFIVTGTGAVVTNLSAAGTLYSAGTLGTAQPVISTNTLTLSYSTTLT